MCWEYKTVVCCIVIASLLMKNNVAMHGMVAASQDVGLSSQLFINKYCSTLIYVFQYTVASLLLSWCELTLHCSE